MALGKGVVSRPGQGQASLAKAWPKPNLPKCSSETRQMDLLTHVGDLVGNRKEGDLAFEPEHNLTCNFGFRAHSCIQVLNLSPLKFRTLNPLQIFAQMRMCPEAFRRILGREEWLHDAQVLSLHQNTRRAC